jgi:hypothetical protein
MNSIGTKLLANISFILLEPVRGQDRMAMNGSLTVWIR